MSVTLIRHGKKIPNKLAQWNSSEPITLYLESPKSKTKEIETRPSENKTDTMSNSATPAPVRRSDNTYLVHEFITGCLYPAEPVDNKDDVHDIRLPLDFCCTGDCELANCCNNSCGCCTSINDQTKYIKKLKDFVKDINYQIPFKTRELIDKAYKYTVQNFYFSKDDRKKVMTKNLDKLIKDDYITQDRVDKFIFNNSALRFMNANTSFQALYKEFTKHLKEIYDGKIDAANKPTIEEKLNSINNYGRPNDQYSVDLNFDDGCFMNNLLIFIIDIICSVYIDYRKNSKDDKYFQQILDNYVDQILDGLNYYELYCNLHMEQIFIFQVLKFQTEDRNKLNRKYIQNIDYFVSTDFQNPQFILTFDGNNKRDITKTTADKKPKPADSCDDAKIKPSADAEQNISMNTVTTPFYDVLTPDNSHTFYLKNKPDRDTLNRLLSAIFTNDGYINGKNYLIYQWFFTDYNLKLRPHLIDQRFDYKLFIGEICNSSYGDLNIIKYQTPELYHLRANNRNCWRLSIYAAFVILIFLVLFAALGFFIYRLT